MAAAYTNGNGKGPAATPPATSWRTFLLSKSGISNIALHEAESKTHYLVYTSLYTPSRKDITLHAGSSSSAPLVGDVDLKNFSGHYSVELVDHEHPFSLEELDRVKGWSSRHRFHYGPQDGKRTFVWRHRGERTVQNRDDLELVEDFEEYEDAEDEDEETSGLVLAEYVKGGLGPLKGKGKGTLRLREGLRGLNEGSNEEQNHWELMVILTSMALIVSRRREQ